jgi:hypothetical protein
MFMMLMFYQELKLILVRISDLSQTGKKTNYILDEYATYIRLIDEILEQRYNYVIQSRRTIETFPVSLFEY